MGLEDRKLVQRLQQPRKEDGDLSALISNIKTGSLLFESGDIHLLHRFQGDVGATAHPGATAHSSATAHSGTTAYTGTVHAGTIADAARVMQASDRLQCEPLVQCCRV